MLLTALVLATNLNFPIANLGNCDSLSSCKTYCEIPWHQTVCTDYGVEAGILEEKPQVLAAVDITFPIPELGNCESKEDCKSFCDLPENRSACVDFARSHGIETSVEASRGRAPPQRPGGGNLADLTFPIPELGNCGSPGECKVYCDQPQNRQACFNFAYRHGLQRGKKEAEKLSGLKFPIAELGNCGSMAECEVYCRQPDHFAACDAYARAQGFEPPGDIGGPGGCRTDEECTAYCSNPANKTECEESFRRMCSENPDWPECQQGPPGAGPGGCTGDEECRNYCEANPDDEECVRGREEWCQQNPDECKKWEGPGGCVSEEECRLYCEQNPDDEECRRGHEEWCRKHPDECRGPEGGPPASDQCPGYENCTLFCEANPGAEYCQRKNEEFCRQNPDKCGPVDVSPMPTERYEKGPSEGGPPQ